MREVGKSYLTVTKAEGDRHPPKDGCAGQSEHGEELVAEERSVILKAKTFPFGGNLTPFKVQGGFGKGRL